MRLFLKFIFQVSENESFGKVYHRIKDQFLDEYVLKKQWFKFEDSFTSKHRGSSIVIQKYPEMKHFLYFSKKEWGNEIFEEPVLSNLDDSWALPNPYKNLVDFPDDQFVSILENIPDIYPFIRSSLAFDLNLDSQLDSVPDKEKPVHSAYKREFSENTPCSNSTLIFQSELGEKHRDNYLALFLRLPNTVYYAKTLPELPSSVLSSIRGLGTVAVSKSFYIPDEIEYSQWEKKRKEAHYFLGEYGENCHDEFIDLKKPNDLPDPFFLLKNNEQKKHKSDKSIPKESIVKFYLGIKGYHYHPQLDTRESITLGKSTKNGNALQVVVHFGSCPSQLSCIFKMIGLSWEEQIRIPFLSDYYQYPIVTRDSFEKAVENVSAMTAFLERNHAPKIEKIYGSSPVWFKASGEIYKIVNKSQSGKEIEDQFTKNSNQDEKSK